AARARARWTRVLGRVPASRAAPAALRELRSRPLRAAAGVSLVRLAAGGLVHRERPRARVQLDGRAPPDPAGVRADASLCGGSDRAGRGRAHGGTDPWRRPAGGARRDGRAGRVRRRDRGRVPAALAGGVTPAVVGIGTTPFARRTRASASALAARAIEAAVRGAPNRVGQNAGPGPGCPRAAAGD